MRPLIHGWWLVLLLALPLFAGCEGNGASWERIRASGILRVGIDPTFPPFALDEGGVLTGIDVDLARAIAAEMGLEAQFTFFGYDGLYDALLTEQVDVLFSALIIAPERTKDVAYSLSYLDAGLILVIPQGETAIISMNDLDGRGLAVELGAQAHVTALDWQNRSKDMTVLTYSDTGKALRAVQTGAAAAALVDRVSGRLFLRDLPPGSRQLIYLPDAVVSEPYAAAVRIDDRELLNEINAALRRIEQEDLLKEIINRHMGP